MHITTYLSWACIFLCHLAQHSVSQEAEEELASHESKIATLQSSHYECMFELKRRLDAIEEYKKCPSKFLKQLIPKELSETNALDILEQAFPYVTKSPTTSATFDQLMYSCFNHCLNPELLIRIAEIVEASERVKEQQAEVLAFCASLSVESYINMREYKNFPTVSLDALAEIVLKLSLNWPSCKVGEILRAVNKFCHIVKIPPFLCRLYHIERAKACIVLTVFVPKGLTTVVQLTVPDSMGSLEVNDFVAVTVSGKELFSVKDQRVWKSFIFKFNSAKSKLHLSTLNSLFAINRVPCTCTCTYM